MTDQARVRVNLTQRELEIEGSESFVRSFGERLEGLLESLADAGWAEPLPAAAAAAGNPAPAVPAEPAATPAFGTFGEFLTNLPGSATDVDKILAAGLWGQSQAADDCFATGDANKRLLEQGIKVGNASQCVKQSVLAKRVFVVQRGRFRVSQIGRQHLRQLMGAVVPA